MKISIQSQQSTTTVTIDGRIDTFTVQHFDDILKEVTEKQDTHIVVDFSHVSYISSTGIRGLLLLNNKCVTLDKHLSLKGLSASIMEIFRMTDLVSVFTIES